MTGLIGSGRTELALALFGISPAERGEIRIDGSPVRIASVQDAVSAGIAYVPENKDEEGIILNTSSMSAHLSVTNGPAQRWLSLWMDRASSATIR